jgi:hypothetical protein
MAGSRSPDTDPKEGEANPESSLQNLCPSVFICGCIPSLRLRALARRFSREKLILLASLVRVLL